MASISIPDLKLKFESGDEPSQQDYIDLIDTLADLSASWPGTLPPSNGVNLTNLTLPDPLPALDASALFNLIPDEWVNLKQFTPNYSDPNSFVLSGDHSNRFVAKKRVRLTVDSVYIFTTPSSAVFDDVTNTTLVIVNDAMSTNGLTEVFVSVFSPFDSGGAISAEMVNSISRVEAESLDTALYNKVVNMPSRNICATADIVSQSGTPTDSIATLLFTGNGTSQNIIGLPALSGTVGNDQYGGLVKIKNRTSISSYVIVDSIRGAGKYLSSDSSSNQIEDAQTVTALNADGFSVGSHGAVNNNLDNIVAEVFQTNRKLEPTYGANLLVGDDSTFDATVGNWTGLDAASGLSVVGNRLRVTNNDATTASAYISKTTVVGKVYEVSLEFFAGTITSATIGVGTTAGGTDNVQIPTFSNPNKTFSFVATATTTYLTLTNTTAVSGEYAEWDNITINEVLTGLNNHNKPVAVHYNNGTGFSIIEVEGSGLNGFEFNPQQGDLTGKRWYMECKNLDDAYDWNVQSSEIGNASNGDYLWLNSSNALSTSPLKRTIITGDTISIDANAEYNGTNEKVIIYFWVETPDVSAIRQYIGTGAGGNYVDLGFKTQNPVIKNTNGITDWLSFHSIRGQDKFTRVNQSTAEETLATLLDYNDNGIHLLSSDTSVNQLNSIHLITAFKQHYIDATKATTKYDKPLNADQLSFSEALFSYAKGFNTVGQVDSPENVLAQAVTFGAGYENKKMYAYRDNAVSYGFTENKPLEGRQRGYVSEDNQGADTYGVASPSDVLTLNDRARTTANHFDYESESGVALASGERGAGYEAYIPFNKHFNDIAAAASWEILTTTTSFVQYKHTEKRILKSWRLREHSNNTLTPNRFIIEGSNDDLNWTGIDTTYKATTGVDFNTVTAGGSLWSPLQDTSGNTTPFLYHRISITSNNGHITSTGIAELEFNTVSQADYFDVTQQKMFNDAGTAIERVYFAEVDFDSNGYPARFKNDAPHFQRFINTITYGNAEFRGELKHKLVDTATVYFDGTQNPPLINSAVNIVDIVDIAAGKFKLIFGKKMDTLSYQVTGSTSQGNFVCDFSKDTHLEDSVVITTTDHLGALNDLGNVSVIIKGGVK